MTKNSVQFLLLYILFFVCATSAFALNAPTNLRASVSATSDVDREYESGGVRRFRFIGAWDDTSTDEDGFITQSSVDEGATWVSGNYTAANISGVQMGQIAGSITWFRVAAYKGSGTARQYSEWSNILKILGIAPPRLDPAVALSATQVKFTWFAWTALHDGYRFERSIDGGVTFSHIGDLAKTATEFTDTFAFEPKLYYYRMCAFINGLGCSIYKNVVEAKPAMRPVPPGIAFQIIDHQSLVISVIDNSDNENDFIIQRSLDGQNWNYEFAPIGALDNEKDYVDSGLQANRKYYYRAWSRNWNGNSDIVTTNVTTPNTPVAGQTEFYVNAGATGTNNGTSWENAWPDVNGINWAAITPGSTITISGGPDGGAGKNYSALSVLKSGTQALPISVVTASASEHRGRVRLRHMNFGPNHWVTIDGRKNRSSNVARTEDVPTNINMEISNPNWIGVYISNAVGIKVFGVEIHHCGVSGRVKGAHGVWINSGDHFVSDVEFAYSYIHDNWQSAFEEAGKATGYGKVKFHHNLIEHIADNGFQVGEGVDIFNNIIRRPTTAYGQGHPDGIQSMGSYIRIYNNYIEGISNSLIRVQLNAAVAGLTLGNIQIYNNVLRATEQYPAPPDGAILIVGYAWPVWATIADQTWDNILIANNTITGMHSNAIQLLSRVPKVFVKKVDIKNNIVVTAGEASSLALGAPLDYTTAKLAVTRNIFAGDNLSVGYAGTTYAKGEDMLAATGFTNSSVLPSFVNPTIGNFKLQSSSTSAIDKGESLTQYLASAPAITSDKDGMLRNYGSGWEIGAYEFDAASPPSAAPMAPSNLQLNIQ